MPFLVFRSIGPAELLIIFGIVVVLFGATRLADIGGAFGRSIRSFRREMKDPEGEQEQETANVEQATPEIKPPQDKGSLQH